MSNITNTRPRIIINDSVDPLGGGNFTLEVAPYGAYKRKVSSDTKKLVEAAVESAWDKIQQILLKNV